MEVPLLSQDEFFRYLGLQSVFIVKFTYRQALKERLRATTKLDSLSLPRNGGKRINGSSGSKSSGKIITSSSSANGGSWTASPKACRRILGRPKQQQQLRRESSVAAAAAESGLNPDPQQRGEEEQVVREECLPYSEADLSSFSILEPLVRSRQLHLHPRMRLELEQYGYPEKTRRDSTDSSSSCAGDETSDTSILARHRYKTVIPSRVHRREKSEYSSRVRIQRQVQCAARTRPVLPGEFPLGGPRVPEPSLSVGNLPKAKVVRGSGPDSAQSLLHWSTKSFPLKTVICDKDNKLCKSLRCRVCEKHFSSRLNLHYHKENDHKMCHVCQRVFKSLWKKKRSQTTTSVCDDCSIATAPSKILTKPPSATTTTTNKLLGGLPGQNGRVTRSDNTKCDICSKLFRRRVQMIRHVMSQHSSQMHKVDLLKFVNRNRLRASAALLSSGLET